MSTMPIAKSELILGGQKSGKSRRAELLARQWLDQSRDHRAVLIATAQPWDDEMRQRIARHQADRAQRVPGMATVEEPLALAETIQQHSHAQTLVVVDCLTLWLTNRLMPADFEPNKPLAHVDSARAAPKTGACYAIHRPAYLPSKPLNRSLALSFTASSALALISCFFSSTLALVASSSMAPYSIL